MGCLGDALGCECRRGSVDQVASGVDGVGNDHGSIDSVFQFWVASICEQRDRAHGRRRVGRASAAESGERVSAEQSTEPDCLDAIGMCRIDDDRDATRSDRCAGRCTDGTTYLLRLVLGRDVSFVRT